MRKITFDRDVIDADVQRLKELGYPDSLIELFVDEDTMRARPLGSKPTLRERIRMLFPKKEN